MSSTFTPILVDVAFSVSEIWLPLKNGQIFLSGHGLSPWSSKNLNNRNRLKKFTQVGIDVKCMHTNFGGHDPSGFRDMATSQKRPKFPFGAWTIVHGHRKI